MSGRLVILPKKSYCPWNPQNVERVLRDERLERERQQQEEAAITRQPSQRRPWQQLQQELTSTNNTPTSATAIHRDANTTANTDESQHYNLFAAEEMAMLEGAVTAGPKLPRLPPGIMAVPLGGDAVISSSSSHRRDQLPFYLRLPADADDVATVDGVDRSTLGNHKSNHERQQPQPEQEQKLRKEERRKAQMDPMHEFHITHPNDSSNEMLFSSSSRAIVVMEPKEQQSLRLVQTDSSLTTSRHHYHHRRRKRRHDEDDETDELQDTKEERYQRKRKHRKEEHLEEAEDRRLHGRRDRHDHRRRKHRHREKELEGDEKQETQGKKQIDASKNHRFDATQPSLEELRQRRAQRETKEAQRQLAVVQEASSSSNFFLSSARRSYHNQYHPSLSRK
jgi:hypothetical protein